MKHILVIGVGYVGLVAGACLPAYLVPETSITRLMKILKALMNASPGRNSAPLFLYRLKVSRRWLWGQVVWPDPHCCFYIDRFTVAYNPQSNDAVGLELTDTV